MRTIASISLWGALLFGGSCDRSSTFSDEGGEPAYTIAYLKSLNKGPATRITQDIVIRGVVTANDIYGEFHKTLIIQDASGAIEIAADHPTLYEDYPLNAEIEIHCNGLFVVEYGGKIQLGTAPDSQYGAGRIPQSDMARYIRKIAPNIPLEAIGMTFAQVTIHHLGMYVRFDGVHFAEPGTWCDTDEEDKTITTDREIMDQSGQRFFVRTLSTCIYAKEPLPFGTGSLYGIIDYFNGKYSLRIIRHKIFFTNSEVPPTAYPSTWECSFPKPTK